MRKDRFFEAFAEHLPYLRNVARKSGLNYDEADEVIAKCSERMLKIKKYLDIAPDKLKTFLHARIRFGVQHYKRDEAQRKIDCARLADPELNYLAESEVTIRHAVIEPPDVECPFCFSANLNEYGACAMCHTIVPSHRMLHREVIAFTQESLAVEFDFNQKIDVQNAIAKLTPYEQKLVTAFGLGNESFESFEEMSGHAHSTLARDWVRVKAKLQELLYEYSPEPLSKRGVNAFRKAVQSIEKTQ